MRGIAPRGRRSVSREGAVLPPAAPVGSGWTAILRWGLYQRELAMHKMAQSIASDRKMIDLQGF